MIFPQFHSSFPGSFGRNARQNRYKPPGHSPLGRSGSTKRTCTVASFAACAVLAGTTGFVDFPELFKPCVNELHAAAVGKTLCESDFRDKGEILLYLVKGGQGKAGQLLIPAKAERFVQYIIFSIHCDIFIIFHFGYEG